ncbi:MAG: sugar isomerase, partial [Armatimonadetes bacterium]|nr:sugar isomerase [Armatimonadota bacterium]
TAPRFMDSKQGEPAKLVTHFESDHGAAIKVEMRRGQIVTVVNPDFEAREWCGFIGEIVGTPFLPVCRSQIEVKVKADVKEVTSAMRGFHCTIAYGDYLKEVGYALSKVGIGWHNLSAV